ncbi:MAG: hypothetical protein A3J69_00770 [Candidatus Levybacteria bacterium RIFCSPHIGHO2_02_FULL_42_12]|nr:MAG: hypothetical protein A3J69_00770 [Candidatus Levybacteria bacterium RIFCSPHIGHO2_02_FULL_42_12]OGH43077.1 MAG: hypothetical protein A3B53_03120 [Candidatus Levybacteria bacterium RIFCSPLOWO2_01_FULL_42_15]
MIQIVAFPFFVAFVLTVLITPLSLLFIKKANLFDDPKSHKHPAILHSKPIPRGGGIPLFIGAIATSFLFISPSPVLVSLFIAGFIALVVGILDDKFDISPYIRFGANIVCASIVVASGVTISFITNPFGGILHLDTMALALPIAGLSLPISVSHFLSVAWIVWVMNMLNWSKGVDGQMPGIVAISSLVIGVLSLRFFPFDQNAMVSSMLSFIIAGSALGFLIYNFYPAKVFPGYGATSVYLLLASVSILSGAKLATAILVMGIPMVDGIFTILRRLFTGHSPFWHDKKHLHHILLDLGFKQRHIALFYWIVSGVLGVLSLALTSTGKFFAIIMLVTIVGGVLLFLHRIVRKQSL